MARREFLKGLLEWLSSNNCYRRMKEKIEKELENEYRKEGRGI